MAILTREQIKERQRQTCAAEINAACLEAIGLLAGIATWGGKTPGAEIENLAEVRKQVDRADAAARLLFQDQQRCLADAADSLRSRA